MSGARTIPKLVEMQQEHLARMEQQDSACSSSDESDSDDISASAIPGLLNLSTPQSDSGHQQDSNGVAQSDGGHDVNPRQHQLGEGQSEASSESEEESDDDHSSPSNEGVEGSATQDVKAEKKAHKKAVKEANRERRKHKMPKHVKKKKMNSHKKK